MTPLPHVAIITAVAGEQELLIRELNASKLEDRGFVMHGATTAAMRIILIEGGIGKANAAAATAAVIERFTPTLIINTGCCGAFPYSGLTTGDLALATHDIFADEGCITTQRFLSIKDMNLPLMHDARGTIFQCIPFSRDLTELVEHWGASTGTPLAKGVFATVSSCSGTDMRAADLYRQTEALCESMEGAAIALTAYRYGIPCFQLRGVSNLVENRDLARWDIPKAVGRVQEIVLKILFSAALEQWLYRSRPK